MRIPERILAEIQSRLDLAEVVGEYTQLNRRAGRWWGRCPFHQEKTPSFAVTPEKGAYYCFGCHKGGGLFQFVMEVEKVPFLDAVEILAKKAGVEVPREEEGGEGIRREAFLELYRRIAGSFRSILKKSEQAAEARRYLANRKIDEGIAEAFQLGWAPADREWLWKFLVQKSYTPDFLVRTGLFAEGGGAGGAAAQPAGQPVAARRSFFAARVVFPIANTRGEILAFGGRTLGDGQPKYLNSPETSFFRKGENLYGIDRASHAIREAGGFNLVEGYVDVLAMHQAGMVNTVAPLGTALTEPQVRVLKRWAPTAVLVFDGDEAGEKATLRAVELCERQEVDVSVVRLPEGRDPADFVQAGEEGKLRDLVAAGAPAFPWLVEMARGRFGTATPGAKERLRDFLFPFVAATASRLRAEDYQRRMADALDVSPAAVTSDLERWRNRQRGRIREGEPARAVGGEAPSADLFLMLALAANRDLYAGFRGGGVQLEDLEDPRGRELLVALEEAYRAGEASLDSLLARIGDTALRDLVVRKCASGEFEVNPERAVADGVRRVRQRSLRRASEAVGVELRRLEREQTDPARVRELLAEKMHLDSELARLGG